MIDSILVLGGGSAGFLTAITLKHRLRDLAITVLRSPDLGIIGVGEGTTIPVVTHLHGYLGVDLGDFHRVAQPTWKLGVRFRAWGPRPYFDFALSPQLDGTYPGLSHPAGYYCADTLDFGYASTLMTYDRVFPRRNDGLPQITHHPAYHIENEYLVKFLEQEARRRGVQIVDATVVDVLQSEAGISGLALNNGETIRADLYIDASGFRSVLLGKALGEPFVSFKPSLFCDRAVIGGWGRTDEPVHPHTTAEAMSAGWCWQIEHEFRINRGYVYSSDFISDADAEAEFRAKNPKLTRTRIVPFISGRHERHWVKNVVAIGNAAAFVEPLESTSLGAICLDSFALAEVLADAGREMRPSQVRLYNRRSALMWDMIRRFLAAHYKFNTRWDTPFWKACVADTDLFGAEELLAFYQENGPSTLWRQMVIDGRDPFGFEGYLSMFVGMNVPYRPSFVPSPDEVRAWQQVCLGHQAIASRAFTVTEALAHVRASGWQWPTGLYRAA